MEPVAPARFATIRAFMELVSYLLGWRNVLAHDYAVVVIETLKALFLTHSWRFPHVAGFHR
jgi:hypothetical protein